MIKLPTILVIILAAIFFVIAPTLTILLVKDKRKQKIICMSLTIAYCIALFAGTMLNVAVTKNFVSLQFKFDSGWFSKQISTSLNPTDIDFVINIAMLFPLGALAFAVLKNKHYTILLSAAFGLALGGLIEFLQFALPVLRSVQLSDLLLNTASATIGGVYFYLLYLLQKGIQKK